MRLALATSLALAALTPAIARPTRSAEPMLTVINAGSEQALKLGETVLSRPFGAQLIDSMAVVGRYGTREDRLYLVEGAAGASCPARYLMVEARPGQPPMVSAPFGTCGKGVRVQPSGAGLILSVAPGAAGTAARYAFANGAVTSLDTPTTVAEAQVAQEVVRCSSGGTSALQSSGVQDDLDRTLPVAYRTGKGLRRADISPAALHDLVAGLACLATRPGGRDPVYDAALPLFNSKRYGEPAFALLDQLAGAVNSEPGLRASARLLSAEMRYRVGTYERL